MMNSWLKNLLKQRSKSENKERYTRILITGVGKTGSTVLFHTILNSLPADTFRLFEPESSNQTLPENIKPPVLVKSFIPYCEHFDFFEKKVLIIRDPRDMLLSTLLYRPYNVMIKEGNGDREKAFELVKAYLELIRRKETSPGEVTVKNLMDLIDFDPYKKVNLITGYFSAHPEIFIMKYEDYIDDNLGKLEKYLQINLTRQIEVPSRYKRVERTKKYGNWKSWFTETDVEYFRPVMKDYLERFGYADDWELDKNPELDPEHGSLYIEKIIREAAMYLDKKNHG
jgi:hypothetical protein